MVAQEKEEDVEGKQNKELFIRQFLSEDEYIEFLKKIDKALSEGFIKAIYEGKGIVNETEAQKEVK
jgi:hypothetical protein